jgi:asparagine synthase (glutamine-hydrolysing)
MCGITGALGRVASTDVTLRLERLTGALVHRGPDGCGMRYFNNRSAGFGHRRLSILDLETGGPADVQRERLGVGDLQRRDL